MKTIFLAVLMAGAATSALAADLPTRKGEPMAPAPVYAPAFTWGGLYVGINGGYAFSNTSNTNFASPNGGLVGGTLGYNWQMGQLVYGVEGDIGYAFTNTSNQFSNALVSGSNSYRTNWMTTERLRLGYAVDRALFYVTGGYAGVDTKGTVGGSAGGLFTQESWRNGGVVGGGIEYAFTNNISAKAEYLWAPMQSQTYFGGTPYAETNHMDVSLFRVGLNYKF
ncbi:MAG TPA: outer membrane beta-barrel protein [Roseiarcus sp.]|nr:outer membrane beta-barrel protein [Roseiarcus sp.]